METIKKVTFHICGMQTSKEKHGVAGNPNYIFASLKYDPKNGLCYFWDIRPVYKYTIDGIEFIAEQLVHDQTTPRIRESLVRCGRKSAKNTQKAIELFEGNVVSAITNRLHYKIELEPCI
nr:hypothetical protein [uncultured Butyrivibrio sp.]